MAKVYGYALEYSGSFNSIKGKLLEDADYSVFKSFSTYDKLLGFIENNYSYLKFTLNNTICRKNIIVKYVDHLDDRYSSWDIQKIEIKYELKLCLVNIGVKKILTNEIYDSEFDFLFYDSNIVLEYNVHLNKYYVYYLFQPEIKEEGKPYLPKKEKTVTKDVYRGWLRSKEKKTYSRLPNIQEIEWLLEHEGDKEISITSLLNVYRIQVND